MVGVTLTGDITALTDLEKEHVPYALARALQDVGQVGKKALNVELTSSFASPTTFTQKGAFGTNVEKGETTVKVGVKDRQAEYLDAEFFGGTRTRRPFESRLNTKFGTKFAVPTEAAPKDRFGNVPPKLLKKIMADAQAKANGYYVTNTSIRYREKGSKDSTKMFNLVDAAPRYKPLFDLDSTTKAIEEAWPKAFNKQLTNAIANPKKKKR
jgi:hypothetical protein